MNQLHSYSSLWKTLFPYTSQHYSLTPPNTIPLHLPTLFPYTSQHYSLTPPIIPLKVFVNMTPAAQSTGCPSIRRNNEINRKAINSLLKLAKLFIQNSGDYFE